MKPFIVLLACLAGFVSAASATTYYVDGGCTNNGTGASADCAASPGGAGAFNVLFSGNALVKTLASGDTLDVRGAHAIATDHTSSANHKGGAAFDGWYFERWLGINFSCSAGGCTVKAHGWTSAGTGEYVVISGTRCPHPAGCTDCDDTSCLGGAGKAWTQCSTCASGTCNGVAGTCTDTWFTTDNGTAGGNFQNATAATVAYAVDSTGAPSYGVAGVANLADTDASFKTTRCATSTWKPCAADADCYPTSRHGTCSGSATQVNSYSNGTTLFVHYGSSLPTRPYVAYDSVNTAFDFQTGANLVTIAGFNILAHAETSIYLTNDTPNITLDDLTVFYNTNHGGNSRGISHVSSTPFTVQNSELGYSADEGIHAVAKVGTAAAISISNNWFHDQGNSHVVGSNITSGTPSAILLGDDTASNSNNDYTGTVIAGNLITDQVASASPGYPFRIETASNWIFRNNIITNQSASNAMCVTIGHASAHQDSASDSGQIYNNLFKGCPQGGIEFHVANASGSCSSNVVYNNTFVDCGTSGNAPIYTSYTAGTMASNLIRNNILYSSGSVKQVNWTNTTGTNLFEYNLVTTSANPAVTWLNVGRACAAISAAGTGNINGCPDPVFVNGSTDFHLQTTSPAKNVGTSTGMPAGRTADINNTLASLHGLVSYADATAIQGGTWDIGLDEFLASATTRNPRVIAQIQEGAACPALSSCSPSFVGQGLRIPAMACRAR